MKKLLKYLFVLYVLLCSTGLAVSQCAVNVDVTNLQHITCPNGGSVGVASISQTSYLSHSWENITNGQLYNGGGGNGGTYRNDLDAGFYVITGSSPYGACPSTIYSDTFEILEAEPAFQFNPTQACPDTCNVEVTIGMQIAIAGVNYSSSFDSYPALTLPYVLDDQCGGSHTYEIFANGISCGIENIGISQFAQMNLATSVVNATCTQPASATVSITGVGASGLSTYCSSTIQYNDYTTIDNVVLVGDNTTISNNTSNICDTYQDYTVQFADVTPGSSYNLNLDLGTCHISGFALVDIANVYVDWNLDGDFNDLNEWVGQVSPAQSPSTHTLAITVPVGAIPGQSRMRIVAQNYQYQPSNQALPCDVNTAWFGSTEDYTIQVNGSVATPVTYLWSDGQTTQTATNLTSGTYTITITDANGCTASDTAIVNGLLFGCMNPLAFNYDPNAQCDDGSCIPVILGCTDPAACNYDSTATIDDGSCTTSITANINPPSSTSQKICLNGVSETIIVEATGGAGIYQYQWWSYPLISPPFPPGNPMPSQTDSFYLPPSISIGVNYYYCIVTSSGQSCLDATQIAQIEVIDLPYFTIQPQDSSVCVDAYLTINIDDTIIAAIGANAIYAQYQWWENSICDTTVSGGAVLATGPGNNTNTYTPQTGSPGTIYYYCTVTYQGVDGCNSITSQCAEIIVNPIPAVTLSAAPNPACLGDDIVLTATPSISVNEYRFMYNDGSGWNNLTGWSINNPVIYNNITQSTQFRVKVREATGCTASTWSPTVAVTVNPLPTATIAFSDSVCLGGVVPDLLAYGSLPNWYSDAALTIQVFTGNYFTTGETAVGLYTYYVTETLNGCEGPSVPVTLEIYALPIVTATADQTICSGGTPSSLSASSSGAGTYSWTDALGTFLGNSSTFSPPSLTSTTTYTVTFTETSSGCTNDDDVTITVNPVPTVTLTANPNPACIGDDIILTATPSISVNEYRFMYNDGSGWTNLTTPSWDINNPVIYNNITQSTQFRVKVREANGCTASSWSPTITVPIVIFNSFLIWHN